MGTVESLEHMQSVLYHKLLDYTLTNEPGIPSARAAADWQLNSQVLEVLAEDSVLVASLTGTSLTALGSLASGPLAALCASGVVASTLVTTEWGILNMDELAHREAFETALLQTLTAWNRNSESRCIPPW